MTAALTALLLSAALALPAATAAAQDVTPDDPVRQSGSSSAAAAGTPARAAFVPVRRFWSGQRDIALDEIRAAIEGRSEQVSKVVVATADATALWAALDVTPADSTVRVDTVREVKRALDRSKRALGLVAAGELRPDLRALAVDGVSLVGSDRLQDLDAWPLLAEAGPGDRSYDPGASWTMIAGGDVMLDREPHRKAVVAGKGADWLWDGGFAEISDRTCCTVDGGPAIETKRIGPRGAVRALLTSADLAVVNHEAPAPDDHRYHPTGLIFTVDPSLLPGLAGAGVDVVSLANNHIRNAGSTGVTQTIRNLRDAGLPSFGAGADEARARRPWCADQGETRVCLLGYNEVDAASNAVRPGRAGAAELITADVKADIKALRRGGADVIVVWPHWGAEYETTTEAKQRRWARQMVRAGADVVLGNHSHVVGPIQFIDGAPVFYSLGNLVFDLPRFEATEEGVLVELIFHGRRLVQIELHPTVMHDRAQLQLLERDGDGRVVVQRMREASRAFE